MKADAWWFGSGSMRYKKFVTGACVKDLAGFHKITSLSP